MPMFSGAGEIKYGKPDRIKMVGVGRKEELEGSAFTAKFQVTTAATEVTSGASDLNHNIFRRQRHLQQKQYDRKGILVAFIYTHI